MEWGGSGVWAAGPSLILEDFMSFSLPPTLSIPQWLGWEPCKLGGAELTYELAGATVAMGRDPRIPELAESLFL